MFDGRTVNSDFRTECGERFSSHRRCCFCICCLRADWFSMDGKGWFYACQRTLAEVLLSLRLLTKRECLEAREKSEMRTIPLKGDG
jgi:hypothetical protein